MTADQRDESIFHLSMQPHYSVEALRDDIEYHYGVVYQSQPSYDDLLQAGGLSWHQTQAANPNREEAPVWQKREEIKKNWQHVRPTSYQVK